MLYYIYRLCLRLQKEPAVKFPMHKLHKCINYSIARKEVSMYRNFIFDLYGTLVDIHTNEHKLSLWKKLALFYSFQGAAYTEKELRCRYRQLEAAARKAPSPYAYPEICAADIFRILYTEKGIQPSESLLTATGQFFRIESLHTLQCYPASIDTLQKLHENGCGVYLLSNAQRIFTEYELRSLGLWELFDGILISSDEGCCKPDPAFFRILFDRYGLNPADCLMIGNERTSDLAGAVAAGIDCCYLHTATSSGSAGDTPEEARFTVMDGDSYSLQKLLLTLTG